ncbi:unnamed protein product, partial [Bubo scandiacus]
MFRHPFELTGAGSVPYAGVGTRLAEDNMKLAGVHRACQYRFPYPDYLLQKNRAVCTVIEQVNSLSHK